MNPLQWGGAVRGLQKHLDPSDSDVSNGTRNPSRAGNDTYCQYSRYTAEEARDQSRANVAEETNDMEFARKCDELREIQQKIILKKAALALKALEPGLSPDAEASDGKSLRNRVNVILQQRRSRCVLPKVVSPRRRMNSSMHGLLLEDHPLKLRVKALMKQRCSNPPVLPRNTEVPDVTPPLPRQRFTPPPKEETGDMGFQRFLSVLNKGVDINLLSRIVNEDGENPALGEEFLNIQPSAVEDTAEMAESQGSHSRDSLPRCSGTEGEARRTSLPSGEKSINDSPVSDMEKHKNEKGVSSVCSRRESQSPTAVKKKKKKEEEPPKVDEQHEQLQNILKTLGLSLEVEEMSKLADRTQERLYGKKPEGRVKADSQVKQEGQERIPDRHCRSSSSSSSSSSPSSSSPSSRLTSRSGIPSLSRQYASHTWHTKRKREPECSNSGDGNQDSEEAQRPRDRDIDEGETSSYLHQYLQEQVHRNTQTAALPEYSDYILPQCSRYTYYNGATTNSYSTYAQGVAPPFNARGYPYPPVAFEDIHLLVNPDLSTSEGQAGSAGQRCLQVIRSTPQWVIKQHERKVRVDHTVKRQMWSRPPPEVPVLKKKKKKGKKSLADRKRRAKIFSEKRKLKRRAQCLKYKQSKEDKRPPPEDKRPAPEDKRPPPEDKRLAPEDKRPPPEDKRPPPEDKRPPPEDKRPPPEDKRLPPEDKRPPPEDKRLPPEDKRPPPEDKRPPPENKRPPPEDKRPAPEVKRPPPEDKRPPPEDKRPPPENKRPPPEVKRPPPEVKRPPPENKRPPPEDKRPPPEDKRPPPEDKRPPPEDKRPPPEDKRPPPENKRPPPEDKRPPPEDKRPPPEDKRPAPEDKRPPPEDKRPPPEVKRPPPENKRPPPEVKRPPPEDKRPPPEDKRPPPEVKRLPPENKRPHPEDKRPHRENKRPPPEDKRPPPENKRPHPEDKTPHLEDKRVPPEDKRVLSEQEMKVNLRKKLEAFNQRAKQRVTQPANGRTPYNECEDYQDLI